MTKGQPPKATLSSDAIDALKVEFKTLNEGAMALNDIVLLPKNVHVGTDYQLIADVIRGGQAYILPYTASRNTIFHVRQKLKAIDAPWNTQPNPKDATQTIPRKDRITTVLYAKVSTIVKDANGQHLNPTKNTALYLPTTATTNNE